MNPVLHQLVLQQAALAALALRRSVSMGAAFLMAGLLGLGGTGCATAALWLALAPQIGTPAAGLVSAAALLGLGFLLIALTRRSLARSEPQSRSGALDTAELERNFKANKATILVAAMAAGLVAGGGARR